MSQFDCAVDARGVDQNALFRSAIAAYSLVKEQYKVLGHYTKSGDKYAQSILEGIAMEDFKKVEAAAQQLYMLSEATDWAVHKTLPYMKYSADFRMLANDMQKNAKQRKLEAFTLEYMELTMTCVRCHSHLRMEVLVFDSDFSPEFLARLGLSPEKSSE